MDLATFEQRARAALTAGLPGGRAHLLLAPRPRHGWEPDLIPDGCRDGAGLMLVYPHDDQAQKVSLVLTVRHAELTQHAGQVSLPGGAVEDGETIAEAALREAGEEIGLDPAAVRVLGELSPLYIPVSGFALHPVLAVCQRRPAWTPDPREVDRVLEVPFAELTDPRRHRVARRTRDGVSYDVPFIRVQGENLWGATAMILAELLWMIDMPPAAEADRSPAKADIP